MRRLAALFLVLLPLGFAPACGGGGGGDTPTPCLKAGTLRALGLQGQPAPDTAGNFGAFPSGMKMDVAENGWAVFVAPTTDPTVTEGLFVALPDGTVHLVFRVGETVPDAGGGTILSFPFVRVNAQGHILAHVMITADAGLRNFGLLSAQVVGGVVTAKNDVVYHLQDMSASGVNGTLTSLDDTRLFLVDDGRAFFAGQTTSDEVFWVVNLDGSSLTKLVSEADSVPTYGGIGELRQVGVSRSGSRFAFVANVSSESGLWIGTTGSSSFAPIAGSWSGLGAISPVRAGTILDIHGGGPLLVFNSGAVVWKALGDVGSPDDVVLIGNSTIPFALMARSGDTAPSTGGATFGGLELLQHSPETSFPMVRAQLVGTTNGVEFAFYGVTGGPPALAMYEGRPAPSDVGSVFTDQFSGVNAQGYVDIARNGAFGFAGQVQTGVSGIFWLIPNCGFFTIAASGQAAPAGGTFRAFVPSTHTGANDVVLFRGLVSTAGSGVFRQGP